MKSTGSCGRTSRSFSPELLLVDVVSICYRSWRSAFIYGKVYERAVVCCILGFTLPGDVPPGSVENMKNILPRDKISPWVQYKVFEKTESPRRWGNRGFTVAHSANSLLPVMPLGRSQCKNQPHKMTT